MPPSALADRTNSPKPAGTPTYYKLSSAPAEDEIADLPIPPPPPAFDEHETAPAPSEQASSSSDHTLAMYMGGHAAFLYLYLSGASPASCTAWLILAGLIINGVKMSISARSSPLQAPSPETDLMLVAKLHDAVELLNRFKLAEPKLTFTAACGAWALAVAASYVSALALCWMAFTLTFRLSALSPKATDKLNTAHRAAHAKAVSLYAALVTPARIEWLQSTLGLSSADVEAKLSALLVQAERHSDLAKVLAPLGAFFAWAFLLGWTHKLLIGGMALLGCKAFMSAEEVSKLDAKIGQGARKARRMTMSACEAVHLVKRKAA